MRELIQPCFELSVADSSPKIAPGSRACLVGPVSKDDVDVPLKHAFDERAAFMRQIAWPVPESRAGGLHGIEGAWVRAKRLSKVVQAFRS